jgi:glycosyltransferase involved in cell wall biosynthesis
MHLDRYTVIKEHFPSLSVSDHDGSDESYISDRCIVLYFGSVLPLQGTDIVLEAMRRLVKTGKYICIFIGPVCKGISLEGGKRRDEGYRDSDGILHIDWLPEQKLAELIDISDICLAGHFAADIDKAKRTIPGKAYIYKAMDKPMVLGDNEANRELFAESDRIAYAVMGDPGSIVEAVEKI